MLKTLFKPKWRHEDPEMRLEAVAELEPDDPALATLAQEDADPKVRSAAAARISNPAQLKPIFDNDSDTNVREAALARCRRLLAGQEGDASPSSEQCRELLGQLDTPELWAHVALHADERELRAHAMEQIKEESVLGQIAINDSVGELRGAALDRVGDEAVLREIARASRNRDKGIARRAQQRLDELAEQRERPERLRQQGEEIAQELEKLGAHGLWEQDQTKQEALEQRRQALGEELPAEVEERIQAAIQHFKERVVAHQNEEQERDAASSARTAVDEELEQLLAGLPSIIEQERVADLRAVIEALEARWQAVAGEVTPAQRERHQQLHQSLEQRVDAERHAAEALTAMAPLCAEMEKLLETKGSIDPEAVKSLRQRWDQLKRPHDDEAKALIERFDQALHTLRERIDQEAKQRKEVIAALDERVKQLEQAMEEGKLARAEELRRALQDALPELEPSRRGALDKQLKGFDPKLRELRDWQRWGTSKAREELCVEMEGLAGAEMSPEEIQSRIRKAQSAWKKMDQDDPGSGRRYWNRFNAACNKAYEPCKEHFEKKAEERRRNREKREQICQRIEELGESTNWSEPDWQALDKAVRRAKQEWRDAGPTDRKQRKTLDDRFTAALDKLKPYMDDERERNLKRKRQQIEQAKELAKSEDLGSAINEIKQLQKQWITTVSAKRSEEQALWQEFRGACDAIFDRRREQQDAANRERDAAKQAREKLCEALEALKEIAPDDIERAQSEQRRIHGEWMEAGHVPKAHQEKLDARYRKARSELERRFASLAEVEARQQQELLAKKAALCGELEGSSDASAVERLRGELESLPKLENGKLERSITARFERAAKAAESGESSPVDDELKKNLAQLEELVIRMEILAEVESPPEAARARMAYQVQRLSRAMEGRGPGNKRDEAAEVERSWRLTGPVEPELRTRLEQRFERALNAYREKGAEA